MKQIKKLNQLTKLNLNQHIKMLKSLKIIFFIILSNVCISQIPDTCFTSTQIQQISVVLDSMDFVIKKQSNLISEYNHQIELKDTLINSTINKTLMLENAYNKQTEINKELSDKYYKLYQLSKPKWYNNKYLWFGLGTLLTTSILISPKL